MASAMARPVEFKPWKNPTLKGNSPSPRYASRSCWLFGEMALSAPVKPPLHCRQGHACAVVEDKTYLFGGSCVVDETTVYLADLFCLSCTCWATHTQLDSAQTHTHTRSYHIHTCTCSSLVNMLTYANITCLSLGKSWHNLYFTYCKWKCTHVGIIHLSNLNPHEYIPYSISWAYA